MNTKPYKHTGNRATVICKNGHFSVQPLTMCEFCKEEHFPLQIVARNTRIPAKLHGFLAKDDNIAILKFDDGTKFLETEESIVKNFIALDVHDQNLFFARIFSWKVVTI